jgi:hypothetical protein
MRAAEAEIAQPRARCEQNSKEQDLENPRVAEQRPEASS